MPSTQSSNTGKINFVVTEVRILVTFGRCYGLKWGNKRVFWSTAENESQSELVTWEHTHAKINQVVHLKCTLLHVIAQTLVMFQRVLRAQCVQKKFSKIRSVVKPLSVITIIQMPPESCNAVLPFLESYLWETSLPPILHRHSNYALWHDSVSRGKGTSNLKPDFSSSLATYRDY